MKPKNKNMTVSDDPDIKSFEIVENKPNSSDEKKLDFGRMIEYVKKQKYFFVLLGVVSVLLILVIILFFKCSNLQNSQEINNEMITKLQEEVDQLKQMEKSKSSAEEWAPTETTNREHVLGTTTFEDIFSQHREPLTFTQLLPVYIAIAILILLTGTIAFRASVDDRKVKTANNNYI